MVRGHYSMKKCTKNQAVRKIGKHWSKPFCWKMRDDLKESISH